MTEMTDGQEPAPEETLAPGAEEASAEVENQSEATTDDDGDEAPANPEAKPAKGVQKRLDELTKRFREAERREERLLALLERGGINPDAAQPAAPTVDTSQPPREDQFDSYEAWQDALIDYRVDKRLKQTNERTTAEQRREALYAKASARYGDFNEVVNRRDLTITPAMADVILNSEHDADIAYHLGNNPDEARRIAALPPHRQGIEVAKIEARFSAPKPAPKDPPPPPPKTVNGLTAGTNKDPGRMSMAEYVAARAAGQL